MEAKTFVKSELLEVRDVPGKGQGLFALQDIAMGEILMREEPLILMPDAIFELEDPRDVEVWIDKRINRFGTKFHRRHSLCA